MGSLEDRLRRLDRLEEQVIRVPSVDEYLDASNREEVRALHTLAKRLEKYGYDGGYLFTDHSLREAEVEGAREKLLAKLEARGRS
jgi:Tfp pilus assembly protein PilE